MRSSNPKTTEAPDSLMEEPRGARAFLAIAKKYVQLHGGYISVDSIMNIGSTFTIHIPKKRPDKVDHHDT